MSNPKFDQICLSKQMETKAKITRLGRLLTIRNDGERVTIAKTVDQAVTNELRRVEKLMGKVGQSEPK
jgi:hypothetical protein